MTTPVTPDAVEAAARAMYERAPWVVNGYDGSTFKWTEIDADDRSGFLIDARAALAAAAPLIAKQTLEEAYFNGHLTAAALTACAATLTPKEN